MENELARKTNESWRNALAIYENGGFSKSYALITLSTPLKSEVPKGTAIMVMGKNAAGNEVAGKMNDTTAAGVVNVNVKVQYATTDVQDSYVECQVGSLIGDDTIFPDALPTMVKTPSLLVTRSTLIPIRRPRRI